MNSSSELKNLAAALNKAQAEIRGAVKDNKNDYFKSKYADLESVMESCREQLSKYGLSYAQFGGTSPSGQPLLVTRLMHISGEWLEGGLPLYCSKPNDPQALGSAITYNRRYGLAAMLGIPQIDDDAESAMDRGAKTDQLKAKLASVPSANPSPAKTKTAPDTPGDFF